MNADPHWAHAGGSDLKKVWVTSQYSTGISVRTPT